jgi:hypothetical protein
MRLRGVAALPVAAFLLAALSFARAETKMADLNGEWRGAGSDRDLPIQSLHPTSCRNVIRADQRNMTSEMTCQGPDGARKAIRLVVTMDGNRFSGTVRQIITPAGSNQPNPSINGTVTGQRVQESAQFQVSWSGLLPNTSVALNLTNASSYAMVVSSLGATMMNVTFNRVGKR